MKNNFEIDGNTPLGIAATALLTIRIDDFFARWKKALRRFDPEDIHDLRVASRRLREGFSLFTPCYPDGSLAKASRQVRKVTRLLGEMRNTDEALIFFRAILAEVGPLCHAPLTDLISQVAAGRKRERQRLEKGLGSPDRRRLRKKFIRAISTPLDSADEKTGVDPCARLAEFAGRRLEERSAEVLDILPAARLEWEIEAQHRLRITVKRLRYRVEILSFLFGSRYEGVHQMLRDYQELLGRMHDLDLFAGMVGEPAFPSPAGRFVLQLITDKRGELFQEFSRLIDECPLAEISVEVRTIG